MGAAKADTGTGLEVGDIMDKSGEEANGSKEAADMAEANGQEGQSETAPADEQEQAEASEVHKYYHSQFMGVSEIWP
ncbi:hypothetical protein [Arthrobacter sp. ISL-30]|uniref:hypothetical protein n=1 Tax=Arthrobacter sp. ISL-30 TaxID=2819109 RepID=UPI001BEBAF27|nr:hypothetical protein [Arthrobacter sp. ISL-30]MBT2512361.1 hypothetical protein [Arthrobacter sp. ISL-30]